MLTALTTGARFRVAMFLAAFAAICFVAPPAVLAFGHGDHAAHCLTHADALDHGMPNVAGKAADHGDHVPLPSDHKSTCCGLFCLSALAPDASQTIDRTVAGSQLSPPIEPGLSGHIADRLDRPPISLSV